MGHSTFKDHARARQPLSLRRGVESASLRGTLIDTVLNANEPSGRGAKTKEKIQEGHPNTGFFVAQKK